MGTDDERKHKHHKHHKHEHKHHHHKHRHHRDKSSSKEEEPAGAPPERQLSAKDYFSMSAEFRAWLSATQGKFLDEVPSAEARKLFAESFVPAWNSGCLSAAYYSGAVRENEDPANRTRYRWAFRDIDPVEMGTLRDAVARDSETAQPSQEKHESQQRHHQQQPRPRDDDDGVGSFRSAGKRRWRDEKEDMELILDEVAPRETGRAALGARRANARAARRAREDDEADFTGGIDLLNAEAEEAAAAAREAARQRARAEAREAARTERLSEYQRKEDAKIAALRLLAAASGNRIRERPEDVPPQE